MMKKTKNILVVSIMTVFLLAVSLFSWFKPSDDFSDSERRGLKQFPQLNVQTLLNGTFMSNFEGYTLDQFPLRDSFRSIKSAVARYLFVQSDVNDLYLHDDYIVSMEYPYDAKSVDWAISRFNNVYNMYLKDTDVKLYLSIIPDKNYFLAEESGHLALDYEEMIQDLVNGVPYMEYIDILSSLSIEDYYLTDTHWNQTRLLETANILAQKMEISLNETYETVTVEGSFKGVYYGQMALPVKTDTLSYLNSDLLEQCIVYDHQNNKEISVYEMEKATGKDPYEMFLGGPLSLVTIENPNAATDKELIIFRDSFGSSIAPLLVEGYTKVTLVDIRYIQPAALEKYMTFDDQDVLFMYSTSVLNNSSTLK